MSDFWSPIVHDLTPYVPGEQPKAQALVKLNTNECPYGPSPRALTAMTAASSEDLRLYPDPQSLALCQAIAAYHDLPVDHVFVGNGSDEVLAHVFMALLRHGRPILFPDISYSFYPVYARLYGIETRQIPLAEDFSVCVDDYLQASSNGGIILPNPNAPTGMALPLEQVERLLQGNPDSVLVLDEAYVDFGALSADCLIARYPQLLVVRTLSKSRALAGLRVGYALGQAHLIKALVRVKDSFNSYPLSRVAQAGAQAAMEDVDWFEDTRKRIMATRARLVAGLQKLGGQLLPSSANFVFVRFDGHEDGAALAAALRARRVLVRHFSQPARIAPYVRISVGSDQQIDVLLGALHDIFNSHSLTT